MFYQTDGVRLALGRTSEMPFQLPNAIAAANNKARDGFDLPRFGSETADPLKARHAKIPDVRNDENLAVGQTHLLFMRFHNRVVDHLSKTTPSVELFDRARETVVKHYQWMVWHDHLPQIVDPAILDDVMANGRKVFEPNAAGFPTMPIEFSVAAYRLGHSMIRPEYDWNAMFGPTTPAAPARLDRGTLDNLFRFSGTSGNLSPFASAPPPQASDLDNPIAGRSETLPNIWVADWTRLFDFAADGHATPALADNATLNHAMVIDIHLTNPLANLPLGSFDNNRKKVSDPMHLNLAFRNLARGKMVKLASGQDVEADFGVDPLLPAQILGNHFVNLPAVLSGLVANGALSLPEGKSDSEQDMKQWADSLTDELASNTPLWYYCLREAELHGSTPNANGNKLGPVGGRIVAETFHRAIQGSRISFLREVGFEPTLNRDILGVPAGNPAANQFRMTDMVKIAFDHSKGELPLF